MYSIHSVSVNASSLTIHAATASIRAEKKEGKSHECAHVDVSATFSNKYLSVLSARHFAHPCAFCRNMRHIPAPHAAQTVKYN